MIMSNFWPRYSFSRMFYRSMHINLETLCRILKLCPPKLLHVLINGHGKSYRKSSFWKRHSWCLQLMFACCLQWEVLVNLHTVHYPSKCLISIHLTEWSIHIDRQRCPSKQAGIFTPPWGLDFSITRFQNWRNFNKNLTIFGVMPSYLPSTIAFFYYEYQCLRAIKNLNELSILWVHWNAKFNLPMFQFSGITFPIGWFGDLAPIGISSYTMKWHGSFIQTQFDGSTIRFILGSNSHVLSTILHTR